MEKAFTPMLRFILVGVLTCGCFTCSCRDDGMLIAEEVTTEPTASATGMSAGNETELEKAAVKTLLVDKCGSCHGTTTTRPAHSLASAAARYGDEVIEDIGDIDALVQSGLIEPGVPEDSPLVSMVKNGQMPPETSGQPPLSARDLRRLEKFIVRLDPPTQREVAEILVRDCGSCHTAKAGGTPLPINDITNLSVLVAAGLIVPGERSQSQLYTSVSEGSMPPAGSGLPPVSSRDLWRLGGFIDLLE